MIKKIPDFIRQTFLLSINTVVAVWCNSYHRSHHPLLSICSMRLPDRYGTILVSSFGHQNFLNTMKNGACDKLILQFYGIEGCTQIAMVRALSGEGFVDRN